MYCADRDRQHVSCREQEGGVMTQAQRTETYVGLFSIGAMLAVVTVFCFLIMPSSGLTIIDGVATLLALGAGAFVWAKS